MNNRSKYVLITLLVLLSFTFASCIGSFVVTHKLYDWNKSFKNKWGQEGIFLAFVIIPVYGVTLLGDALIFNTIEFWSGNNPMADKPKEKTLTQDGETAKLMTDKNGRILTIEKYRDGKLQNTLKLEKLSLNSLRLTSDHAAPQTATLMGDFIQLERQGRIKHIQLESAPSQIAMYIND